MRNPRENKAQNEVTRMTKRMDIDEVKTLWQQEQDKYICKAVSEDLEEYSPEIQAVIREEALKRGLIKEEKGQVVLVKEVDGKKVSKLESMDSVKDFKPWLAKTQIYIGEVTAGIMAVLGFYTLVSFFSRFSKYEFPHWSSNTALLCLLGTMVSVILSVCYFSAIRKRKVKTVRQIYRIWWITSVVQIGILFFDIVAAGIWTESTEDLMICVTIMFGFSAPFVLITLLWWLGLRGLKQMCGRTEQTESFNRETNR